MSFDINMNQLLQYAFNLFGSFQGYLTLMMGAFFGAFVLKLLIDILIRRRS